MKQIDQKYFENPEQYIPYGDYCYTYKDNNYIYCPFIDKDESLPEHENGYCHYLRKSDYDFNREDKSTLIDMKTGEKYEVEGFPMSYLWDHCKECGVKEDKIWIEEIQNTFK